MNISFFKMQSLGNDFVVIDATRAPIQLSPPQIEKMADRRLGIGFDQLLLLETSDDDSCDFIYRIFNADGGEVEQCGNGARCIALYIWTYKCPEQLQLKLKTLGGVITATQMKENWVKVAMGKPRFKSSDIPYNGSSPQLNYSLTLSDRIVEMGLVNIGNPHAVMDVKDLESVEIERLGSEISNHPNFPERVNVGFMQVLDPLRIYLRVYERGVGETLACGTGACAAVVIGQKKGLLASRVKVIQSGGELVVSWHPPDGDIIMEGPAYFVFSGEWL